MVDLRDTANENGLRALMGGSEAVRYSGGMSESRRWSYARLADDLFQGLTGEVTDPIKWVQAHGEFPWSVQREILTSVRDNRYTAVQSCHEAGKSFIASRIIAWWIDSHPPGTAFVVSTAPSAAQVATIMWREVAGLHRRAELPGRITSAGYPQWKIDGEVVGIGRKPGDYEESAFQGYHAEFMLVIIDEACGVPEHLYDAIHSLVGNDEARVLAIGNPDDPSSHFATKVCKAGSEWNVIHIDALRTPNMTAENVVGPDPEHPRYPITARLMEAEGIPFSTEAVPDSVRKMLVGPRWVEERLRDWAGLNADSPIDQIVARSHGTSIVESKIRGLFPTSASDGIIPLGWIMRAVERGRDQDFNHAPGARILGVDVARTGDDQTCFAVRQGSQILDLRRMHLTDTMEVVAQAATWLHEPGSTAVVDVIGIGSGVYDRLAQMKNHYEITGQPLPFNASSQSSRRDRLNQFTFFNDRAAAWWRMRELLDPAFGSQIALPDDDDLVAELAAPRYNIYANGRLKVEAKDEIRKRLGRSTDSADAVIQAFWVDGPAAGGEFIPYEQDQRRYKGRETRGQVFQYGYDPFSDADMAVGLGQSNLVARTDPLNDWVNETL